VPEQISKIIVRAVCSRTVEEIDSSVHFPHLICGKVPHRLLCNLVVGKLPVVFLVVRSLAAWAVINGGAKQGVVLHLVI
jgi:hypothetical protein